MVTSVCVEERVSDRTDDLVNECTEYDCNPTCYETSLSSVGCRLYVAEVTGVSVWYSGDSVECEVVIDCVESADSVYFEVLGVSDSGVAVVSLVLCCDVSSC